MLSGCNNNPADTSRSRESFRAYYGAPPVIPHAVRELGRANCLACHADGLRPSEGPAAVPKPHATLGECTQCHVEQQPGVHLVTDNHFVGLAEPQLAGAAYPGAPRLIPHRLWLRENCLACHGPNGHDSMRTSHPERTNCIQCHIPQEEVPLLVENEFHAKSRSNP
jgi:cytochrome c-type protein NapB